MSATENPFRYLDAVKLSPSDVNPRQLRQDDAFTDLVASIASKGVLQPLVVRAVAGNTYEIVMGHRRYAAGLQAGLCEFPCLVREVPDGELLELMLTENMQRQDLSPLEEARAMRDLLQSGRHSVESLGQLLSLAKSTVWEKLRLLEDCPELLEAIATGRIPISVAQCIRAAAGVLAYGAPVSSPLHAKAQAEVVAWLGSSEEGGSAKKWSARAVKLEIEKRLKQEKRERGLQEKAANARHKASEAKCQEEREAYDEANKVELEAEDEYRREVVTAFEALGNEQRMLALLALWQWDSEDGASVGVLMLRAAAGGGNWRSWRKAWESMDVVALLRGAKEREVL